jgi:uridine phosphorylase
MGGPSASVVLADLAELGVQRAVRIGTGASLGQLALGEVIVVTEAQPRALPDPGLTETLRAQLGDGARTGTVVSLDSLYRPERDFPFPTLAEMADMQTAALLASAEELGVAAAALLVVTEKSDSSQLADEDLETAAKVAGSAVKAVL